MLKKNGYIDYLVNFPFSGHFLLIKKGQNINNDFSKTITHFINFKIDNFSR